MKLEISLAVGVSVVTLALPACDKKTSECKKVADIANAAVAEMHKVEAEMHGDAHDPSALAKDAKTFIELAEQASKNITAVEVKTEGLRPHIESYTGMLDQAAGATKELLGQLESASALSEEKLQATQKALEEAQAGLGKVCEGQTECEKIVAAMEKLPDAPSEAEIGKMLADHAAELKALELENAAVQEANQSYVSVLNEYVELIALAQRLDASVQKIDAAVEKEDEIVAAINQFCFST